MSTVESDAGWVPPSWAPPSLHAAGTASPPAQGAAAPGQLPRQWFDDHFDGVWRLVARLGVPSHCVDDVVQETFITASRRYADIRAGQERRFLIGTALRISANYRNRASVRHEVAHGDALERAPTGVPSAEQLLIEKREREQLERALEALPAEQRNVFVLYELEGFSTAEIAELLGLPSGTVASRLGRARAHFSRSVARWSRGAAPRKDSP
jgi:RNA polymerase sigma-70 factor, ECF subfamily